MQRREALALTLIASAVGSLAFFVPNDRRPAEELSAPNPPLACDLNRGPCAAPAADNGKYELSIAPRPIPLMQPLRLRVTSDQPLPSHARLIFSGVEMDMGFNDAPLRRDGDGALVGMASLPVCTTGRMRWKIELFLDQSRTSAASFEFVPN